MTRTRKRVTMLVTVSVPRDVTAAHARREVKTLVGSACNWSLDPDDVKVISIKPATARGLSLEQVDYEVGT